MSSHLVDKLYQAALFHDNGKFMERGKIPEWREKAKAILEEGCSSHYAHKGHSAALPNPSIPLEPEKIYHIYTHANGSENLFRCDENYRYFLGKYAYHVHPVVEIFAYCLMPSHLHLMVRVRGEEQLACLNLEGLVSQRFSNLFNAYTKAYKQSYDRKGSRFIPPFPRKPITEDAYFTRLIAYIHNNPIHHGFVQDLNNWPHVALACLPARQVGQSKQRRRHTLVGR